MKRIRIVFILGVVFLFLQSCFVDNVKPIRGNGNVVTHDYDFSDFDKIDVGDTFVVYLSQGDNEEVTISADENLFPFISVEKINGRLKVHTTRNISYADDLSIYITMIDIDEIEISGASEIYSTELLEVEKLLVDISGASEGELEIFADHLNIELSGSSEVYLDLVANIVYVDESGASDVELVGETGYLHIMASGSSALTAFSFLSDYCDINCGGASHADINVIDQLSVIASGASNIRYMGQPAIEIVELSGSSTLEAY